MHQLTTGIDFCFDGRSVIACVALEQPQPITATVVLVICSLSICCEWSRLH